MNLIFSTVSKVSDFLSRNRSLITKVGLPVAECLGAILLSTKYDIPISIGNYGFNISPSQRSSSFDIRDLDIVFRPKNPIASAIYTTTKQAENAWSDYSKEESVNNIYKLITTKEVDDETKEYAIVCMNKIGESMSSDWYRGRVQKKIIEIVS